jgi:hypothetical protein
MLKGLVCQDFICSFEVLSADRQAKEPKALGDLIK